MYHFTTSQLRVVRAIAHTPENAQLLSNSRFIILEHILPTTEELLQHLKDVGAEILAVIAKPYSIHKQTLQRMKRTGYRLIKKDSYEPLESTDLLKNLIAEAVKKSRKDKKKIVLIDVGGYFTKPLRALKKDTTKYIAGVVEDTTFGHNLYNRFSEEIDVPMASVARSDLKEIEARFVGRDAVHAMDKMLREIGISLAGRNALVIGYGMIGKYVARTLRRHDLNVYVYDIEDCQMLKAFSDGFHIHKKVHLLRCADIIFSATGSKSTARGGYAMSFREIEDCKNHVVLASVGSKDVEFDVAQLKHQAHEKKKLSDQLVRYALGGKHVIVAREGTAVNFLLPSIPREILDIVFAELLQQALLALKGKIPKSPYQNELRPRGIEGRNP